MPTSKVIRPAVFDETGEHVIPADADLNLDPVSSDPDNYIVRGSDGGAFLNGDGVLSNDGENLLKTSPNDGKVTYPRSDAVSLITETVQPFLDTIDGEAASAQTAAEKAQAAADKAQASADQAKDDAAAAQCTATQALNDAADAQADADKAQARADAAYDKASDAADAQADADKAQARADAAYDKASDAQCAAADALEKAQEAVDKLPEIADEHVTVVTAGDGIKVDHTKNYSHNVYQVSVKRNGDDSGLISSTDGLEVELKGNGGIDKDKDGLYVDQQWIDEMVARYAKDHMLFNQVKVVKQLPEIPDADVHTIYLIRNRDSSATDAGTKDSFDGWIIVTTENGTQKWEEIGYKTDLRGYTHTGNTVMLTGDAAGTGTVDANGNVVVPTAVSHAASADKTTGGTVNITGYVSGSGSFDRNGNVTVDVVPNVSDTPSTWYVGKTNARDYWGKDENGNQWGSTKNHPFATLTYAINETNKHTFPGNTINIMVLDAGEYVEGGRSVMRISTVTSVSSEAGSHPVFRGWFDEVHIDGSAAVLELHGIDFAIQKLSSYFQNGITILRVLGNGVIAFYDDCHLIIDTDNFGSNKRGFIDLLDSVNLRTVVTNVSVPALTCELRGNAICTDVLQLAGGGASYLKAPADAAHIMIKAPSGTKLSGAVVRTGRFTGIDYAQTVSPNYKVYFGWDIADDSDLVQVAMGRYSRLVLNRNPAKGQALPGHATGDVPATAEYESR